MDRSLIEDLPDGVQALIINMSDVPIDTFLHYRKAVGAVPKKLAVSHETCKLLDNFYEKRVAALEMNKKLEKESNGSTTAQLSWFTKDFDRQRSIEIMIGEDYNTKVVKFAFRARETSYEDEQWPELWTVRKTICELQTGKETDDWMRRLWWF
jgi:hypothetical protein